MDFKLPSFPQGMSSPALPSIPVVSQAPVLPNIPQDTSSTPNSIIYTITARVQVTTNKDNDVKRDKHSVLKLFLNKTLEIKLKKDIDTYSLEKHRLEISDGAIGISTPSHAIKIWLDKPDLLTFAAQLKFITKKAKSKSPISVVEGDGYKLQEGDIFRANINQWEIKNNTLINITETTEVSEKTAINAVQSAVVGHKEGSYLVFFTSKKAMMVEITHAEKMQRRIPAAPVAERLAQMEDLSDQLIQRAEQYVRYRRMSAAVTKLKKRNMELDAAIDANAFEITSLSNGPQKITDSRAERAVAEAKAVAEAEAAVCAIDGVEAFADEIRLAAGCGKFGDCAAAAFGVFCAVLAEGSDFSPEALISRLERAQQEVTAALV